MRLTRCGIFNAALAAVMAMTAAACQTNRQTTGGSSPDPNAEPITLYSGRSEELVGPIFEEYTKKTGIKLNVKYGDTAELAALILEEGDRSPADVFLAQDAGALGAVAEAGRFDKLSDEVLDRVDAKFRSPKGEWVGVTGRARVLVYNTTSVTADELPASVTDLKNQKWRGKVGWAPTNGSFQAFVTAMRKLKGEAETKAWLEAVKENAKVYAKNSAIVEAVGAGEIEVGLVNHYYLMEIKEQKPDIPAKNHYFKNGDVGSLVNVSGAGILRTSKNKEAARELLTFFLSDDAQKMFADGEFEYPLVEGVKAHPELPELSSIEQPDIDLSDLDDLQGTLALLREVGAL